MEEVVENAAATTVAEIPRQMVNPRLAKVALHAAATTIAVIPRQMVNPRLAKVALVAVLAALVVRMVRVKLRGMHLVETENVPHQIPSSNRLDRRISFRVALQRQLSQRSSDMPSKIREGPVCRAAPRAGSVGALLPELEQPASPFSF